MDLPTLPISRNITEDSTGKKTRHGGRKNRAIEHCKMLSSMGVSGYFPLKFSASFINFGKVFTRLDLQYSLMEG